MNEQRMKKRDETKNRLLTVENKLMLTKGEVGGAMGEMGDEG